MKFSQYAGIAIIPTFARIVLGVCFISVGWCQISESVAISSQKAERLRELGVEVKAVVSNEPVSLLDNWGQPIVFASYVQDPAKTQETPPVLKQQAPPPTEQEEASPDQDPGEDVEQDQQADEEQVETPPADIPEIEAPDPSITTTYSVKRFHIITLALAKKPALAPYASRIAFGAALTQLVGGTLLFMGLFSRLCALALLGVTCTAFYFHSLGYVMTTVNPLNLAKISDLDEFDRMARYLAFSVLSLGVLLTGPGPLSLDRLLFRREPDEEQDPLNLD